MKTLYQLINQDGEHVGLYLTDLKPEEAELIVKQYWMWVMDVQTEDEYDLDMDDGIEVYLEKRGFERVFAEELHF